MRVGRLKRYAWRIVLYDMVRQKWRRGDEYIWANLKIPLISPRSFFGRAIFDVLHRGDTFHVREPKGYANIIRFFHTRVFYFHEVPRFG